MQPSTAPTTTSLTWCLPSIIRDTATQTAHDQTKHFHMTLTWKCMTRNVASINARDACPLGNEYLPTETVIMSSAFSAGRWRRTIAFVSTITTTSNTSTAHKNKQHSIATTCTYLYIMLSLCIMSRSRRNVHLFIFLNNSVKNIWF